MDTIFVSIASYRDSECPVTLKDLYDKAKFPRRVFVGICQQNDPTDSDCVSNLIQGPLQQYSNNIKIMRIDHTQAKGPTYARYLCSTLHSGQKYYLQIDSHIRFVKDWDTILIDMINKMKWKNNKVVISYYPKEINDNSTSTVPKICKSFFNERGMISFYGAQIRKSPSEPTRVPFVAGGFFFCDSRFLKELPFDPNLDFLFTGEEILLSARFFTNGWDIYSPNKDIIYHEYTRDDKPKVWNDLKPVYDDSKAHELVKSLLNLDGSNGNINYQYGLGKVRTLQQFYDFTGIDISNKSDSKDFCIEGFSNISVNSSNWWMFLLIITILLLIVLLLFVRNWK